MTAVLLTAPLFAVTHFFAKASIPPDQLHWSSGFDLLARSFAPLGHPALVIDSLLAWLAVGLILSFTRVLTGNIAVAIGLHAGWVFVLRILQESTGRGAAAPDSMWVGRFDGLLGYWLLPWAAAIGLALWLTRSAVGSLRRRHLRRDRRQPIQPLDGIVHFEIALLVAERNRQDFGQAMAHPRGIVEPHLNARVHLAELRQHGAQQFRQSRMTQRHRHRGFRVDPLHLGEMQAIGLAAARVDAETLLPQRTTVRAGRPAADGNR